MANDDLLTTTLNRLLLMIRAGYPVIYIVSNEETRVFDYLFQLFRIIRRENPAKELIRWDAARTMARLDASKLLRADAGATDPSGRTGIDWLAAASSETGRLSPEDRVGHSFGNQATAEWSVNAIAEGGSFAYENCMAIFFDVHHRLRWNASTEQIGDLVRPLRNAAEQIARDYEQERVKHEKERVAKEKERKGDGKDKGTAPLAFPYRTIIVVAPSAAGLAEELVREVAIVDFPLPDQAELCLTLESSALVLSAQKEEADKPPEFLERVKNLLAAAGRGLTLEEFRRGLSLIAARGERLEERHVDEMLERKSRVINTQALRYTPRVEISLGGLKAIKAWVQKRKVAAVDIKVRDDFHLPPPKGVLLCGVPGGGKSQLAKYIAQQFSLALLQLDVGALFGQYVGESEERTRRALQLAELLSPVVLWLDEVDKAFGGMDGGDNGVSRRVFGHFLTWLSEQRSDIFVVATANDIGTLLRHFPEFGRKGRFDEIFWVGPPDKDARAGIFEIYLTPHVQSGYLQLNTKAILELAQSKNLPLGDSPLKQFASLLADSVVSDGMTGAEIEQAITVALYEAYDDHSKNRSRDLHAGQEQASSFTPARILECVKNAAATAMFGGGRRPTPPPGISFTPAD